MGLRVGAPRMWAGRWDWSTGGVDHLSPEAVGYESAAAWGCGLARAGYLARCASYVWPDWTGDRFRAGCLWQEAGQCKANAHCSQKTSFRHGCVLEGFMQPRRCCMVVVVPL